jgi:hypothetical protein
LSATGKWSVKALGGAATSDVTSAALLADGGTNSTASSFFVYKTVPTYTLGAGRTVTSASAISQGVNGVATLFITSDDTSAAYSVTSSGVGSIQSAFANNTGAVSTQIASTTGDTVTLNNAISAAGGVTWTPATVKKSYLQVKVSSAVAGTTTLSVTPLDSSGTPGGSVTATVTWGATPLASTSVSKLAAGNDCSAGTASSVYLPKTAGVSLAAGATTGASLCVAVKDQSGLALNGVPLDVSITGPGLVSITSNVTAAQTGTTRTASLTASNQTGTAIAAIGISADGTAGTTTVTVSTGTTVLATASIYFYGAAATVAASQVLKVASTSGGTLGANSAAPSGADSANSPAVIVTVKDAFGTLIPNLTSADISAATSDASVMSSTLALTESSGAGAANTTAKTYNVQVNSVANTSGKSATLTFRVLGADGVTFVTSAPIKFTLGGSVATVGLSLDHSSYSLGSTAVATLTAKDSSGNAAKDGILATTLSDVLTSSLGVNKTLFGASVDFIGGVSTVTFNAPAITGAWTITGTTGTGPSTDKVKALTVSATVTGGNDAAIASLITKINALAALIAKIQKKLGIK